MWAPMPQSYKGGDGQLEAIPEELGGGKNVRGTGRTASGHAHVGASEAKKMRPPVLPRSIAE